MKIIRFALGQLQANCYFVIEDNKCLIIDPADEASFILEEIQRRKLKLTGMIATHGHFDHVMAVGEIQLSMKQSNNADLPLLVNEKDFVLIHRLIKTAEHFLGYQPAILKPAPLKTIEDGRFEVNPFQFRVIATPGHTPGSSCIYFPEDKIIFTGDTLFKGAVGRYDFSYSNKKKLKESLKKLISLPKNTIVYPGHGEQTKIGMEQGAAEMVV